MALITAIFLFLVGSLGTAVSRLLTDEFKAWIPWIVQRVIRRAIARLTPPLRERFEEEWQSHINELPGEIGKLKTALGCLTAARKMTLAAKAGHRSVAVSRFLNRFGGVILLVYSAPLMLIISLVALVSTGSVFTATEHVVNDRKFKRLRFSASGRLEKYLLRTKLNELPSLINVVRGETPLSPRRFWWERDSAGNWK
jgi:hypothetical protein